MRQIFTRWGTSKNNTAFTNEALLSENPTNFETGNHPTQHFVLIEAGRRERHYWFDLWRYRELFMVLAWRDLSVRYKQTIIGIFWALIRPLLAVVIFTIVFGHIAKLPSDGTAPYALMVFAGMLPFMGIQVIALVLLYVFPEIGLWLPQVLYGR
jgi:hypothetical protein